MKVKMFSIMLYGNKKYSFDKNQLINFIDSFVECDNYNNYIEEEEVNTNVKCCSTNPTRTMERNDSQT